LIYLYCYSTHSIHFFIPPQSYKLYLILPNNSADLFQNDTNQGFAA